MNIPNIKNLILYGAIIALLVLLFISKCSNLKQAIQNIDQAVSKNRIEILESNVAILEKQNLTYRQSQDSLILIDNSLNKLITQKEAKYAQIASIYADLKNKVKELNNDSTAGLFLDRADCTEFPVLKYDTNYIMPIEPIRFYNLMSVDFDELKAQHQNLQGKYDIKVLQVKNLIKIIDGKEDHIANLDKTIESQKLIETEKDKQIQSEHKKYKQQKVKTFLVGGAGLVLFGAALAL